MFADIKKVYVDTGEMILRDTLVMIQCTNCGKMFNRSPTLIARSKNGNQFCSNKCTQDYRERNADYLRVNGSMTPEGRVDTVVRGLTVGEEYTIGNIASRIPKHRSKMDNRTVGAYLKMRDDMRLVNRGVWVRVTA
jgi:hypothetical protein